MTAKDIILSLLSRIGVGGGTGHVFEYAGSAIRALGMEGRMTVCNMSIEGGARAGLVAPDETTFEYVEGRPHAPMGADWDAAVGGLAPPPYRRRRRARPRHRLRCGRAGADGDLRHEPRHGLPDHRAYPDRSA